VVSQQAPSRSYEKDEMLVGFGAGWLACWKRIVYDVFELYNGLLYGLGLLVSCVLSNNNNM